LTSSKEILNIPLIIQRKKNSKNYHPALKKEPNITEYGLDASLRCDWAGGHEMLPAPS
jgi:hypothetical protein